MTWLKLPGRVKGKFKSMFEAVMYIEAKGISSDSELERITSVVSKAMDFASIESNNECEPGESN